MSIEITNECEFEIDESSILRLLQFACKRLYLHPEVELAVMFVDEEYMTTLHVQWMDEPGPTDVLSFPMDELRPGTEAELSGPGMLGDIVICPSYASIGAKEREVELAVEIELLAVHGLLHLLGYDHATSEDETEMFGLQNEILQDFHSVAGK